MKLLPSWLSRRPRVVVPHRRSKLRLAGDVTGGGTLHVGVQWPGRFPRESHLVLRSGGRLHVEGDFNLYSGATVTVGEGATLSLGSGYINGDASISCFLDVRLGHGVAIGPELMLIDDDRHTLSGARGTSAPIVIGDRVWLGSRVTVLKGVTIGDGAVVAAHRVFGVDRKAGFLGVLVEVKLAEAGGLRVFETGTHQRLGLVLPTCHAIKPADRGRGWQGENMRKYALGLAAIVAFAASPATAAIFDFTFDTTRTLFGGPDQTIRGTFTTLDTPVDRFGFNGLAITGISGTINGTAISGLYDTGLPYYYITSGPTFLDGSGVRFNAGAAQNIAFFHQDNVPATEYRVEGNGTISAFGSASSSPAADAVPEPATWAMMLIGFGMVGLGMRRRKSSVRTSVRFASVFSARLH